MKISVLGCGRWGTFIAWYMQRLGHETVLYGRDTSDRFLQLKNTRTNGLVRLEDSVLLTADLAFAAAHADAILISIGSQNLRALMQELSAFPLKGKPVVLCMKGLEEDTGERLTQIASEYAPGCAGVAIWVGPGHVQDFVSGKPNCMVIDCEDDEIKKQLVDSFSSELIRFYYGKDLLGNEIGAASKNVIGIAAGFLDGMNLTSLKGALMSRGTREIARLITAMGGNEITAYGLGHLGDYEATVFSPYSHNRKFGESFVLHEPYKELAEGVYTCKALMRLSGRYAVDLPICRAVYSVLYEQRDPKTVLSELFMRSLKEEF